MNKKNIINNKETLNVKIEKKADLHEEIDIPDGIIASFGGSFLIMKKNGKELKRKLISLIDFKIDGNKLIINSRKNRKIERRLFGTFKAHINNMIKGLNEMFVYKLKIVNVHFPMNVSYNNSKNELIVKNFLGEKKDRIIKLIDNIDVTIEKDDIIIRSHDIEKAGMATTKIESGTKVRKKDRRIFQDGIFIVEKPWRIYS